MRSVVQNTDMYLRYLYGAQQHTKIGINDNTIVDMHVARYRSTSAQGSLLTLYMAIG